VLNGRSCPTRIDADAVSLPKWIDKRQKKAKRMAANTDNSDASSAA
jgi:hypothetical protein